MERVEPTGELGGEADRLRDGQRALNQPRGEGAAHIERHHYVVLSDVEDRHDVPRFTLTRELGLACEPLLRDRVGSLHDLEGHFGLPVGRAVDDPARAFTEHPDHPVAVATHAAISGDG